MRKPRLALSILLVDDQLDNLEIGREVLNFLGATVYQATSVKEALTVLERLMPDMILTDLSMPDQDGYELLARVKAAYPSLPVIAVTACSPDWDRDTVLRAGFSGIIPKPLPLLTLTQDIEACLPQLPDAPFRAHLRE